MLQKLTAVHIPDTDSASKKKKKLESRSVSDVAGWPICDLKFA